MSKKPKPTHGAPSNVTRLTCRAIAQGPERRTKSQSDKLGQVTSAKRYWDDGTPVAGQQHEYAFDDIGNRTSAKAGGDSSGAGQRERFSARCHLLKLNRLLSAPRLPGNSSGLSLFATHFLMQLGLRKEQ